MTWLDLYSDEAKSTDRFIERPDHLQLLAAGLFGEAGSILAEIKKKERERNAYPVYRQRLLEEVGDFLWYFVRLAATSAPSIITGLSLEPPTLAVDLPPMTATLALGAGVGTVLREIERKSSQDLRTSLTKTWDDLKVLAATNGIDLREAAASNIRKTQSRWPENKTYAQFFDSDCPREEQIPRSLTIEFLQRRRGTRIEVLIRHEGINIGDRISDNIGDPDGYRYHDIFHIAYAAFLGWSPVIRSLLRAKRKSKPEVDENEDGARALILEEAVSAIVFSRAKNLGFFADTDQIDYDLLKTIQEFITGYEVETVPVWQWEEAIREGYRVFRLLRDNEGGIVSWSLPNHSLTWSATRRGGGLGA